MSSIVISKNQCLFLNTTLEPNQYLLVTVMYPIGTERALQRKIGADVTLSHLYAKSINARGVMNCQGHAPVDWPDRVLVKLSVWNYGINEYFVSDGMLLDRNPSGRFPPVEFTTTNYRNWTKREWDAANE